MSISISYIINDPKGGFVDWADRIGGFSIWGKWAKVYGSGVEDSVFVQAGASADLTALSGGSDKVYLTGRMQDYQVDIDQSLGLYTLTRQSGLLAGQSEVIKFTASTDADELYFSDGHIVVGDLFDEQAEVNAFRALSAVTFHTGGTPEAGPPEVGQATDRRLSLEAVIEDPQGLAVPQTGQTGQWLKVYGTGENDSVYVRAGTSLDGRNLSGGVDKVYLTGNLADYDVQIDQSLGLYTLTRKGLPGDTTEVVMLTVTTDEDVLYFANGHVVLNSLFDIDAESNAFKPITTLLDGGSPGLTDVVDLDTAAAGNHYTAAASLSSLKTGIAIAPNAGDSQRDINSITVAAKGLKLGDKLRLTGASNVDLDTTANFNTFTDITIGGMPYRYTWDKDTATLVLKAQSGHIASAHVDTLLKSLSLINTTVAAELGTRSFDVTLQNDQGSGATSTATLTVDNAAPIGGVALNNLAPHQGDALTLSTANLTDADGIPTGAGALTYVWQHSTDGSHYTDIGSATTTYTLTQADVGTTVRAVVRYTDNNGSHESVTSTATAAVVEVNDAPTLSATAANIPFTEGAGYQVQGDAVALFSGAVLTPEPGNVSSGQKITSLTLTVADLRDGSHETLIIDGTVVRLVNGANGLNTSGTTTNGIAYTVGVASAAASLPVATITLTQATGNGITADIINGIQYQNTNLDNPTAGTRTATIVAITDDGGNAFGGVNSATINIVSAITVTPVDDPTQLKNTDTETGSALFSLGQSGIQLDTSGDFFDPDGDTITYSVTGAGILPTGLTLDASTGIISGIPSVLQTAGVAITVTASDGHNHANGTNASRVYNIQVTNAPVVSRISVSDDTAPSNIGKAGDTVTVVITLSEAVSVSGGSATVDVNTLIPTLKAGASGLELHIDSVTLGADAKTITVIATLPSGDATSIVLTGLNPNGITLTGTGSLQPFNGYTSGGTHRDTGYTLDNTAPNIAISGNHAPFLGFTESNATTAIVNGRPVKEGEKISLVIPLGEDASGLNHLPAQGSTASHILSVGDTDKDAIWSISGSNLVLTYTVGANDNGGISVNSTELKNALQAITDQAGNALTIGGSASGTFNAISTAVAVDTTAPSDITATFSISENTTAVGTLSATEATAVTWALHGSADDNGQFTLASNGALTFKNAPNFEARGSASGSNNYLLHVQATDAAGNVTTADVTVSVTDVDEPTLVIAHPGAANHTLYAQQSVNLSLGADFTDPEAQALTYILSGNLPAGLSFDTNTGVITGTPTATSAGSSVVTITASDGVDNGTDASRVYTLSVYVKPTISRVTASDSVGNPSAGKSGDTITFTVVLSEAVELPAGVTPTTSSLQALIKADGSNSIQPTTASLSNDGTRILFTLPAPASGNYSSLDLQSLTFNNGITLTGRVSRQTMDAVSGVNLSAPYRIDNTAPAISSTGGAQPVLALKHGATTATKALDEGDTISVSIPLGEDATGIHLPTTTSGILTIGNSAQDIAWSRDGTNLVLSYTVKPGDNGSIALSSSGLKAALAGVTDLAGNTLKLDGAIINAANTSTFSFSPGQGVDTTFPVLTANTSYSIAENSAVVATLTASDAVTPSSSLRYSIVGGADAGSFNIGSASGVLSFQSPPDYEGTHGNTYQLTVGVTDQAGHLTTQAVSVSVTNINDAPYFSASPGSNFRFTEGTGLGVLTSPLGGLFTGSSFAPEPGSNNSGQIIQQVVLTVSGLLDGADEVLFIDGKKVPLVATVGGTTTANNIGYGIVISGNNDTATITLTKTADGGITGAIIDGLQYQNTNVDKPTAGRRTITLTQVKDNGGTANGGIDTATYNIARMVEVVPTNDDPIVVSGTGNLRLTSGVTLGNADALRSTIRNAFTDPDGDALTYTAIGTLPAGLTLGDNGYLSGSSTEVGTYHITVSATDGKIGSTPATREYDLFVTDAPVVERITVSDADGNNVGRSGETVTVVITLSSSVTADGAHTISSSTVKPTLMAGNLPLTVNDVSLSADAKTLTVTATLPGISLAGQIQLTALTLAGGLTLTAASGNVFSDETELDFSASYTVDNTAPNLLISGLRAAATDNSNAPINNSHALRANDHVVITIPLGELASGLSGLPAQGGTAGNIFSIGGTPKDARWSRNGSNLLLTYTVTTGDEGALSIDTTALKNILQSITDTAGNAIQLNGQAWASNTDTFALSATPANAIDARAPGITSAASLSLVENSTTVTTLGATDGITTNAGDLSWSIEGGADSNLFTLDRSTGVLVFKAAPDFEGTHGNTYQLTVGVTDQAGNKGTQALTITVSDTNDAPGASITASNATFTEGSGHAQGTSVSVFSAVTLSPEPGNNATTQKITQLVFTVAGLKNGTDEKIIFDGSTLALSSGTGTTTGHTLGYSISLSNDAGTNDLATITLSSADGISATDLSTYLGGLKYLNTNIDNPTTGTRTFTITRLKDDGGTADGGADTSDVSLVSRITVTPVNDAPELASGQSGNGSLSIRKNGNVFSLSLADHFTDPDSTLTFSAIDLPTGLTLGANGQLTGTVTGDLGTAHATLTVSDGTTPITRVYDIEVWSPPTIKAFSVSDVDGNGIGKQGDTLRATITLSEDLRTNASVSASTVLPTLMAGGTALTVVSVIQGTGQDANKLFVNATLPQGNASTVSLTGLTTTNLTLVSASGHDFESLSALSNTANYTLDNTAPAITSTGASAPSLSLKHGNVDANTTLDVGDTITLTVPLGETATGIALPSVVTTSSIFSIGGTPKAAVWSRSGNNLLLSYTVKAGDDGAISINDANLKSALATVTDLAGNALQLDGTSIGASTSTFNLGSPSLGVDTTAPNFTGNTTSVSVFENTALVTTLAASDAVNTGTLRYSIESGGNGNLFALNTSTGVLSFLNAPNFEDPKGGAGNSNTYTVNVGVSDASGHKNTRALTITVSDLNEAPSASTTVLNPTYTEAAGLNQPGAAIAVFSGTTLTPEPGNSSTDQKITQLVFTVGGLKDGSLEKLVFDGSTIALVTTPSSLTTADHGVTYSISLVTSGGNTTATVTLSKTTGEGITADMINGLSYINGSNDNPTPGNRVFTLMQIKDNGGTANGGNDTTSLNISSTVNVTAINDNPVAKSADTGTLYYTNATPATSSLSGDFIDPDDTALTYTAVGSLPDGLTLDAATGRISGTPTADGTTPITVHVSDGHGGTDATKTYSLVVSGHPAITGISAYDNDAGSAKAYGHAGDTVTIAVAYNQTLGAAETLSPSNVQATLYAGGTLLTVTSVSLGTGGDTNKLLISATVPAGIDTSTITLTGLSFTTTAAAALITSTGASHSSVQDFSGSQIATDYTIDNTAPNISASPTLSLLSGGNAVQHNLKVGDQVVLTIPLGEALRGLSNLPEVLTQPLYSGFFNNRGWDPANTYIDIYLTNQANSAHASDTYTVGGQVFNRGMYSSSDLTTEAQRVAILSTAQQVRGGSIALIQIGDVGAESTWSYVDNNLVLTHTVRSSESGAITVDTTALKTALSGITDLAGNPLTIGGSASGTFAAIPTSFDVDTTAPTFSGSTTTLSAYENALTITTLAATDNAAASDLRWSIVGGADSGAFSINPSTGALSFNNTHNYETEVTSAHGTSYGITIGISDAAGNTSTQALTIQLADVNEAPAITATGTNNTFTEGSGAAVQGDAVQVFSAVTFTTEPGNANASSSQKITQVVFTVSGLKDGSDEAIVLPGSSQAVHLSAGDGDDAGFHYSISITSSTASVTLSNANGIGASDLEALNYINTNIDNPTPGDRTFTITSLKDNGGTDHGGVDTATVSLRSVIHVVGTSDVPVLAAGKSGNGALALKIGAAANLSIGTDFTDPDGDTLTFTAVSLPSGIQINSAGTLVGTPQGVVGTNQAQITVSDGHGGNISRTYDIELYRPPEVTGISVIDADAPTSAGKSGDTVTVKITLSEAVSASGAPLDTAHFLPTLVAAGQTLTPVGAVTQGTGTEANVFSVSATLPSGNSTQVTLTGLSVTGSTLTGDTSLHAYENQTGLNKTATYTIDNIAPNVGSSLTLVYKGYNASGNLVDLNTVRDLKAGEQVQVRIDLGDPASDLQSNVSGLASTTAQGVFTVGGNGRPATWAVNGNILSLTYTVAPGDNGAIAFDTAVLKNHLSVSNVGTNASLIKDLVGNAATLGGSAWGSGTFTPLDTLTSADTTGPNITSATIAAPELSNVTGSGASAVSAAASHDLKAGDTITLTIPVGEATTGLLGLSANDSASQVFKVGGQTVTSTWSSSGTNLILTHTIVSGENGAITTDAVRLKTALQNLTDALGNPVTLNNTAWNTAGAFTIGTLAAGAHVVDTTAPNIATTGTLAPQLKLSNSSNTVLAQDLAVGDKITLTVPLGESRSHFNASTLNLQAPGAEVVGYKYNGVQHATLNQAIDAWIADQRAQGATAGAYLNEHYIDFHHQIVPGFIRPLLNQYEWDAFNRTFIRHQGDGYGSLLIGDQPVLFQWSTAGDNLLLTYTVQPGDNGDIVVDPDALRIALSGITDLAGNPVTFGGSYLSFGVISTPYAVNTSTDAPVIRTALFSTPENATGNFTLVATEASPQAGGTLNWALTSGAADNSLFNINTATGVLSFLTAPDFEDAHHGPHYTARVVLTGSDGTSTATRDVVVSVTDVNEAPNITANPSGNTFTEGDGTSQGTAVAVFSGPHLDPEPGANGSSQKITRLVFTVSGLKDGNAEKIILDGATLALSNDTPAGFTSGHTLGYTITTSNNGGTATVTLTSAGGIVDSDLDGLQYQNTNVDNPTAGDRVFTITSLVDDGGTANGGVATRSGLSVSSTIGVTPVNDAPRLISNPLPTNRDINKNGVNTDLSADFVDPEGDPVTYSATGLPGSLTLDANGFLHGTLPDTSAVSFTVTASDGHGSIDRVYTPHVVDRLAVVGIHVSDAVGDTHTGKQGANLAVTLTLSEGVTFVYGNGLTPVLQTTNGEAVSWDPNSLGISGNQITFNATAPAGNGQVVLTALNLNAGAVQMTLTGTASGSTLVSDAHLYLASTYTVDNTAPNISNPTLAYKHTDGVDLTASETHLVAGDQVVLTLSLNEPSANYYNLKDVGGTYYSTGALGNTWPTWISAFDIYFADNLGGFAGTLGGVIFTGNQNNSADFTADELAALKTYTLNNGFIHELSGSSNIIKVGGTAKLATWHVGTNELTLTYTVGDKDEGLLTIDPVALKSAMPNITDLAGNFANFNGAVGGFVVNNPTRPVDTKAPTSLTTSFSMSENNTLVGILAAEDGTPANQLVWSLNGNGADNAKFVVDSHGVLRFKTAPDFETPASAANPASNTYSVQVAVADLGEHTSTGTVLVSVSDLVLEPTLTSVADAIGHASNGKHGDSITATITFAEAISVTGGSLSDSTFLPVLMADGHPLAVTSVSQGSGSLANVFTVTATLPVGNDTQVTLTGLTVNGITLTGATSHAVFAGQASLQPPQTTAYTLDNIAPNVANTGTAAPVLTVVDTNGIAISNRPLDVGDQVVLSIPMGEDPAHLLNVPGNGANGVIYSFVTPENPQRRLFLNIDAAAADMISSYNSGSYRGRLPGVEFNLAYNLQSTAQKSVAFGYLTQWGVLNVGTQAATGVWSVQGNNLVLTHTVALGEHGDITYNPVNLQAMLLGTQGNNGLNTVNWAAPNGTGSGAGFYDLPPVTDRAGNALTIAGHAWGDAAATLVAIASPAGVDTAAPLFNSPTRYSRVQLSTAVATLTATDDYSAANHLVWALASGTGDADNARFSIDNNGVLRFVAPPDFLNPVDTGQDNTYQVRVSVSDEAGHTGYQALTVSVTNPVIASGIATAGGMLTVDTSLITDADVNGISYQWQVNTGTSHASASWGAISGANGATYTVDAGDASIDGHEVRVVVSYTDSAGTAHVIPSAVLNTPVSGGVSYTGNLTSGAVLTLSTASLTDPNGLGDLHIQWQHQAFTSNLSWGAITWTNTTGGSNFGLASAQTSGTIAATGGYTDLFTAEKALFTQLLSIRNPGLLTNNVDFAPINGIHVKLIDNDTLGFFQVASGGGNEALLDSLTVGQSNTYWALNWDAWLGNIGPSDEAQAAALRYMKIMLTAADVPGTANWVNVPNGNATTYTMTDADVGLLMRAVVTYTDGAGYAESVTSATPGAATVTINSVSGDNVISGAEKASGNAVTVTGTTSASDTADIIVGWGAHTHTIHPSSGTWSYAFTAAEIPADGNSTVFADVSVSGVGTTEAQRRVLVDTAGPLLPASGGVALSGTGVQNGLYGLGDTLTAALAFNEPVFVTGTPQVALNIGGVTRQASYVSGSGSATLRFAYTLAEGDTDTNGISMGNSALALNGGTLTDALGNDATLPTTATALADNAAFKVDAVSPMVRNIALASNAASGVAATAGQVITATVSYSEAVTVSGAPTLGLKVGSVVQNAAYVAGSGSSLLTFTYTLSATDNDSDGIGVNAGAFTLNGGSITDAAGNAALPNVALADSASVKINNGLTINTVAGDNLISATEKTAGLAAGGSFVVSGTAAVGLGNSVHVTWGNTSHDANINNGTWTTTFTNTEWPTADGASTISASISSGGALTAQDGHTVTVDTIGPNIASSGALAPALSLTSGGATVTTHDIKVGDQVVLTIPLSQAQTALAHLPDFGAFKYSAWVLSSNGAGGEVYSNTDLDEVIKTYLNGQHTLSYQSGDTFSVGGVSFDFDYAYYANASQAQAAAQANGVWPAQNYSAYVITAAQRTAIIDNLVVTTGNDKVIKVAGVVQKAVWSYDETNNNLVLSYTPVAGDTGAVTVDTAALKTALSGITDLAGNPITIGGSASGTFAAIASPTYQVDGVAPTIGNKPATAPTMTHGTLINLDNLTFSDSGGSVANPTLTLSIVATNGTIGSGQYQLIDGDTKTPGIQVSGSGSDLATVFAPITFTPGAAGLTASLDLILSDPAGNQTVYHYLSGTIL